MKWPAALLATTATTVLACGHVSSPTRAPTARTTVTAFAIEPPPPIALESTDGTALELQTLSFTTHVYGPLAMTDVRARFYNPNDHAIEGRFRLALPPRSSVARLAMKIGDTWREAEVAERSAARATYEMIMHRRHDPLLVEQQRDREVAARVAPLEAGGTREIIVSYTSELASDAPIVFPLRGLPAMASLDASVVDGATEPFHRRWVNTPPDDDVRVALATADSVRAGGLVAKRVRATETEAQPFDGPVVVLVETSAAHAADAYLALGLVGEIARLAPAMSLVAYDQTSERVADAGALAGRGFLGAPILDSAVQNAADEARRMGARRLVVIGPTAPARVDLAAFERVDVLGVDALTDRAAMRPLAKNGVVLEDAAMLDRAALDRALTHRAAEERVVVTAGDDADVSETPSALATVAHVAAAQERDALLAREPTDATKAQLIALAKKHRLATPYTAMLVLENDADVRALHRIEAGAPAEAPNAHIARVGGGHAHFVQAPVVRMAAVSVSGRLPAEIVQRVIRQRIGGFRACYEDGLRRNPTLAGRVVVKFVIGLDGRVENAIDGGSEVVDTAVVGCITQAFAKLEFPEPAGGRVTVVYPFTLARSDEPVVPPPVTLAVNHWRHGWSPFAYADQPPPLPWSESYTERRTMPAATPRTPIDYVALGEALEAIGDIPRAARAYGSLAALWPERTELLRAAAVRIDRLRAGDSFAIALLRRAVADRPDQPSGHHLLGLTLLRAGDLAGARHAFEAGLEQRYALRYAGADDLLRQDIAMLDGNGPPTCVTLAWESDTSDLDISVQNDAGERAVAAVLATANDGFGPEALDPDAKATTLRVKLDRRGLGGDVLGVAHVIKRNERGGLEAEPRPFAIMNERSTLDLGAL